MSAYDTETEQYIMVSPVYTMGGQMDPSSKFGGVRIPTKANSVFVYKSYEAMMVLIKF